MRRGSLAVLGVQYLLHAAVDEWMDHGLEIFRVQSAKLME